MLHSMLLAQREFSERAEHNRRYLRDEMEAFHSASGVDRSELSAEIIQELQASRSFLESDIYSFSEKLFRELHAIASASTKLERLDRIDGSFGAAAPPVVVNCAADEVIVGTEAGYLFCHAAERGSIPASGGLSNAQRGTLHLIQRLVRPGDVFIDVGAGTGLYTLMAARAMQGRGRVMAFEPRGDVARLLEKSVMLNGFSGLIEINQAMLSSSGAGSAASPDEASHGHRQSDQGGLLGLDSVSIDVLLASMGEKVDNMRPAAMIRVGSNAVALEVHDAALAIIRRNPDIAVITEFAPRRLRRSGRESSAWLAELATSGFDRRAINAETGALEDWTVEQLDSVESISLLLARAGSSVLSI
jgi:FkbM family methyltransferase